jgi:hypothetical protein
MFVSRSLSSNGSTRYNTEKCSTESPLVCKCYPLNYFNFDEINILFVLVQIIGFAAQYLQWGLANSYRICITGMPLNKTGDGASALKCLPKPSLWRPNLVLTQQNRWITISHYLNCSGTAANPSWNWLIITEFSLSRCRMKGSRKQRDRRSVSQNGIATCIYRPSTVKPYLTRCREGCQYWMNRESIEHCRIQTRRGLISRILWKKTRAIAVK